MRLRTCSLIAGLAIAALSAASAQAGDKVTLKLRLKKGDEYTQVSKTENKTHLQMNGQPVDMTQTMELEATAKVEEVGADGVQTLATTPTAARMVMDGMMKMEYDSKKPETANNPMGKVFADQLGKKTVAKYDKDGHFKEGQLVAAAQMVNPFGSMAGMLPDHPVGVGDSWDVADMDKAAQPMPMNMKVKMKQTMVGRHDGLVQIQLDGNMANDMMGGMKMAMHGVSEVDEATGMTVSMQMDVAVTMKGDGQMPKSETTMHTTMTCAKKK